MSFVVRSLNFRRVFCCGKNGNKIIFTEDTLNKCKKNLNICIKHKLKYHYVKLPSTINVTDGYHRQCYSSFTSLMNKYHDQNLTHSSSSTDFPNTSYSTPSSPLISEINVNLSRDHVFLPADYFPTTTDDINSHIESFDPIIQSENQNRT